MNLFYRYCDSLSTIDLRCGKETCMDRFEVNSTHAFINFTQKIASTTTHCFHYEFFPPNGRCFNEIIACSHVKNLFFIGISACKPDACLLSHILCATSNIRDFQERQLSSKTLRQRVSEAWVNASPLMEMSKS